MSIGSRDQDRLDPTQEIDEEEMNIQEPPLNPGYPWGGHKRSHDGEGWEAGKRRKDNLEEDLGEPDLPSRLWEDEVEMEDQSGPPEPPTRSLKRPQEDPNDEETDQEVELVG